MNLPTPICSSGVESACFMASSGLLSSSWKLIADLYAENNSNGELLWKKVTNESDLTLLAFVTPQTHVQPDLLPSADLSDNPFQFLFSERNPPFYLNRSAISLFDRNHRMLHRLKSQVDVEKPLIVTGHGVGGSIASLFTLWLFDTVNPRDKHPLCITFGSPLIGDQNLQQAVRRSYRWNSCFLHVVSREDPLPFSLTSTTLYEPFGIYLLCSDHGSACVESPASIKKLLEAMRPMKEGFKSPGYGYVVENLERNATCKDSTACNISYHNLLQKSLDLQLHKLGFAELQEKGSPAAQSDAICRKRAPHVLLSPIFTSLPNLVFSLISFIVCKPVLFFTSGILKLVYKKAPAQQRIHRLTEKGRTSAAGEPMEAALALSTQGDKNMDMKKLVEYLETEERQWILKKRKWFVPGRKLVEMEIDMTNMEWYKKNSKNRRTGYYDSYKPINGKRRSPGDEDVVTFVKILNNYWKDMVEEATRQPQKEGAAFRTKWLYAGTYYRRMVEPLDIAQYYGDGHRDNYMNCGRSEHYKKLEMWLEDEKNPESRSKQNVENLLTVDSCFWAHVEEALISCRKLFSREGEKQEERQKLRQFENYVYGLLRKYKVSPDIFLKKSSYMRWWNQYTEIMGTSYESRLANFMRDPANWELYAEGLYDFPLLP
ncbi:senescence-associated carboxylesterase 101-like isoform X2 [Prosopis cineraria]|uniref:senescence-associated carboxylesterase 101-like isoform X2 n=1 Tax=Prosopis cineraria TaxID=364024 RepID=UPI0024105229|nr:senescence-associated carboxylesterase 101-like isoform X2 [Prosopis cineraria]